MAPAAARYLLNAGTSGRRDSLERALKDARAMAVVWQRAAPTLFELVVPAADAQRAVEASR